MATADNEERGLVHEYRAGWKQGIYEWAATLPVSYAWTATYEDPRQNAEGVAEDIRRAMVRQSCSGMVVVEESRGDGRLHAHGVIDTDDVEWPHGFTLVKRVTDLMGWVTYMFKAFGPESSWCWRKDGKSAKSGQVAGKVRRGVRRASEAEASAPNRQETLWQSQEQKGE